MEQQESSSPHHEVQQESQHESQHETRESEPFESFQLFKHYMDQKLASLKRDIVDESEERSLQVLKKVKYDIPSFKFKGHEIQYKFNTEIMNKIDAAKRQCNRRDFHECIDSLDSIQSSVKKRNKFIRLADRSPSGWALISELEGDDIASKERRFNVEKNRYIRL